jgi:glycosyltransferase involved in cell wall biosynthesis
MADVSVIVPNYNHAKYLQQRIESVLNQTFQDFELIILDDCSTDDSRDVIELFRFHPKVSQIIYNETNSGSTFKQWNKGFKLVKGRYVWIAESDDYCAVDFLEKLVKQFQENNSLGIAYGQSYRVNERSEIIGDWLNHTDDLEQNKWATNRLISGADGIKNYLGINNVIPNASGALFSTKSLQETGGADESFILNGDWFLYLKILAHGYTIAYVPEKLNYFREHSVKVTRRAVLKGYNILEVFKILKYITSLNKLEPGEITTLKKFYYQHYLPQLFRKSVPMSIKRRTLLLAFSIAPVKTLKCLRHNLRKV